jgi:hypothetical protein
MTLVERLRRRHECRECHQTTVHHLINPDGPEAADALETAEKALVEARECLLGKPSMNDVIVALNIIDGTLEKIRSGR